MRELVFKNLTSNNKRRKDLYISETVEQDGVKTVTRRHSMYIIMNRNKISNSAELSQYKEEAEAKASKRHVFIFKKRDTKSQKDSFICDVVGKFYAVIKDDLYSIAFKHSFAIDFSSIGHNN